MGSLSLHLPTLLILIPILGGIAAAFAVTRRAALISSLVIAALELATLGLSYGLLQTHALHNWKDNLEVTDTREWFGAWKIWYDVEISSLSLWLIAMTTLVTACATVFTWYAKRERPGLFTGMLWWSAGSLIGLFVAKDLVIFYTFFELMLVPILFLVGGWGAAERIRATLTLFIYTLVGSLLMLVGVIAVGLHAGSFNIAKIAEVASAHPDRFTWWMLAAFIAAFAVKAPLFPFHGWMPLAYREAPVEVSALLSGLVSKAAAIGMLFVVLPIFAKQMHDGWALGLAIWAIVSLLYGSIAAFRQADARGVVAYSSMAQMGLIVLGLVAYLGATGQQGVAGAYLQTINHGLLSATLFILIGIVEIRGGTGELSRLGRIAQGRPVLATIMLFVAMCALAVPGSNTFAGELLILSGTFNAVWSNGWLLTSIASVAVVFAAMYSLRLLSAVMHNPEDVADAKTATARFGADISRSELAMLLPLLLATVALCVWPNIVRSGSHDAEKLTQTNFVKAHTATNVLRPIAAAPAEKGHGE